MDVEKMADELFNNVKSWMDKALDSALAPIVERVRVLEQRHPEKGDKGEPGDKGKDGDNGKDGEKGADGADVTAAMIDRSGDLILTLSNGTQKNIGPVVGKDGAPGKDGERGEDGLGFDDLELDYDGERKFTFKFVRGDRVKEFSFNVPTMIYRGVWRTGDHDKGDTVTRDGSLWVALEDTKERPGDSKAWQLATKRGADGKNGKDGDRGPQGKEGPAGRDLTQMTLQGKKY